MKSEVLNLFTHIEPDTSNFATYSIKILSLLTQTCVAIEGLFRSILKANNFRMPEKKWNIIVYSRLNKTHKLSDFLVEVLPIQGHTFDPFITFLNDDIDAISPSWYRAYNSSKHDSYNNFKEANLQNLLNALAALFILHVSVSGEGFDVGPTTLRLKQETDYVGGQEVTGGTYKPTSHSFFNLTRVPIWSDEERYNVDWDLIIDQSSYQNLNISS